jgi:DNA repair exonuclease SbcCD ATPase subunit
MMKREWERARWLRCGVVLMVFIAGCARPVSPRPRTVQAQMMYYVNVAEVARHHPLWPSAQRTETTPAPLTLARSVPSPLTVQPLVLPSENPAALQEAEPLLRSSASDERRRRFQQQASQALREFEATMQQMETQQAEAEIQRRLAQASAAEEAEKSRQMENLSQQLSEDLSRWREQELRQLARETQPRRLRLALKSLPAEARQKLEDELKKLETDAASRLEQKQRDIQKQREAEERRLTQHARQRLNDLEQSLRRAMPSDVSLASHRERLARDFAPEAESSGKRSNVPTSERSNGQTPTPIEAAAAEEPAGFGFRVSGFGKDLTRNAKRETRNAKVATLRAYLLKDTAKRVHQLARERRWQLVSQSRAPGVVDKTQECIRFLREGSWQTMKHD